MNHYNQIVNQLTDSFKKKKNTQSNDRHVTMRTRFTLRKSNIQLIKYLEQSATTKCIFTTEISMTFYSFAWLKKLF